MKGFCWSEEVRLSYSRSHVRWETDIRLTDRFLEKKGADTMQKERTTQKRQHQRLRLVGHALRKKKITQHIDKKF